jgi:hypothetical protein
VLLSRKGLLSWSLYTDWMRRSCLSLASVVPSTSATKKFGDLAVCRIRLPLEPCSMSLATASTLWPGLTWMMERTFLFSRISASSSGLMIGSLVSACIGALPELPADGVGLPADGAGVRTVSAWSAEVV